MKKIIAVTLLIGVVFAGAFLAMNKNKTEKIAEKVEIIESGFSSDKNGDFSYAVVFRNNSDQLIRRAYFEAEAYDENGEKMDMPDDCIYLLTTNVGPGETSSCDMMVKDGKMFGDSEPAKPIKGVPADVAFKYSSLTEFKEASSEGAKLRIVDYELLEENFDRNEISFRVRIANDGNEDFEYDFHNGETNNYLACHVVYKDKDGNVIGGTSIAGFHMDPWREDYVVIKAGEEMDLRFQGLGCWPSESQDLYLETGEEGN